MSSDALQDRASLDRAAAYSAAIAALLVTALAMFSPSFLADGDTYWHVAAGRWMLEHRQVLKTDVFSYTRAGAPWDAHEWLAEILMAAVWGLSGWTGLVVVYACAAGAAAWLAVGWMARWLGGLSLVAVGLVAGDCALPSLLARPHLLALVPLALWTLELLRAREERRAPRPAFAALMVVWANLHGSYVFGFVLLAAFGLEALVEAGVREWRRMRGWAVFAALAVGAALINPEGFDGLIYPFKIMGMTTLNFISEWRPVDFSTYQPLELALIVTVFVCIWKGVRPRPLRLALLLFLLHMALQHARHGIVVAVVAPLVLAEPLGAALQPRTARPLDGRRLWPALAAAACMVLLVRVALPVRRVDGVNSPLTAMNHVPKALARRPVLNDYSFGGYLIYDGVKPFIDGRADMYGDRYFGDFVAAVSPDNAKLAAMLDRYDVAWTVFTPQDPVVKALDRQPGWRRLYADKFAVVHVRIGASPGERAVALTPHLRPRLG